jgi:hypothetical protein
LEKTILYDKFLQIESWAYRGRHLVEKGLIEKAREAARRIETDLQELKVLLKMPDKEGG